MAGSGGGTFFKFLTKFSSGARFPLHDLPAPAALGSTTSRPPSGHRTPVRGGHLTHWLPFPPTVSGRAPLPSPPGDLPGAEAAPGIATRCTVGGVSLRGRDDGRHRSARTMSGGQEVAERRGCCAPSRVAPGAGAPAPSCHGSIRPRELMVALPGGRLLMGTGDGVGFCRGWRGAGVGGDRPSVSDGTGDGDQRSLCRRRGGDPVPDPRRSVSGGPTSSADSSPPRGVHDRRVRGKLHGRAVSKERRGGCRRAQGRPRRGGRTTPPFTSHGTTRWRSATGWVPGFPPRRSGGFAA